MCNEGISIADAVEDVFTDYYSIVVTDNSPIGRMADTDVVIYDTTVELYNGGLTVEDLNGIIARLIAIRDAHSDNRDGGV